MSAMQYALSNFYKALQLLLWLMEKKGSLKLNKRSSYFNVNEISGNYTKVLKYAEKLANGILKLVDSELPMC